MDTTFSRLVCVNKKSKISKAHVEVHKIWWFMHTFQRMLEEGKVANTWKKNKLKLLRSF